MGSCAAPSAKGDDKFITTDYLQQCPITHVLIPPLLWINHIWCACASLCRVNCTRSVQIVFFNLDERAHSEIMSSDKVSQIGINHLYFTA
ncbi:hypothetical protein, partial [Klebsiella pneumoniae]|uniref:hypothetical protein n=1 Tax=Klebsiella pneumoniae TaxID=573 RepID=UPI002163339D